ncbi:DUF4185 domain-containing protein [Bacillus cereus]|uniref:DUF4185 domain-containing protein n=1 Tax=Bacillus cereus TaxID=1396 RepID=UPI000DEF9C39|nr:DUF4185 domain-containing protein [Bacillus cereus]MDF3554514.1 DUF4185 domain-containing protein [Bacillus cereus]RCL14221.1 hypothetical protein BLO02_024405 [Bacillus cereus]
MHIIQSNFGSTEHGKFEVVVLEGNNLVHYFHDNSNVSLPWTKGQIITTKATGPGCIIQSNFGSREHGNFEVIVLEGNNLVHYFHDNSDVTLPWIKGQIITTKATGPGCIIQSNFGSREHGNFEVIVLEGNNLVHYFHDNSDVTLPWTKGQIITTKATGPGCIIQSNFGSREHGNFEVIVLEGNNLVHYFHDNSDVTLPWTKGQIITTKATGPGCIIQSNFGSREHGNFEVVVLEGNNLAHYFHDNSDVTLPWTRGQIITTSASGFSSIIQSNFGGEHGNFEVIIKECHQSIVHYWHNNTNVNYPWSRGQVILGEIQPIPMKGTRKIVQLTGEYDKEIGQPAHNMTETKFGIKGTDLGSSFVYNGKIYFLFGDTVRTNHPADSLDSIAYSTDPSPYNGIDLSFNPKPPKVNNISQGPFEVPTEGVSVNEVMYVFFTTDHSDEITMGRTVLAKSVNGGLDFGNYLYDFSKDKFLNVSVAIVNNQISGKEEQGLMIWGSGRYRASDVYLAYMPLNQIENKGSILYYTGAGNWSNDESKAVPLFCAGNIGEFSVRWNYYLGKWIMLYNSDNPRGIVLRTAELPWGPWTEAQIIFDPRDGYCHFMHQPGCDHVDDQMFGGNREGEFGGEYGPYQIAPYATGIKGEYTKIYFTLSTWNPYNVMQMSAVIPAFGQKLDDKAYAYDVSAPNDRKYARISLLFDKLATNNDIEWEGKFQWTSPDYIELAQYHSHKELRSDLKYKFLQMMIRLNKLKDKVKVYSAITRDLILLGAGSFEEFNQIDCEKWALNAIQDGNTNLLVNKINTLIDSDDFLPNHDAWAYAYDSDAPNEFKYARVSLLVASLAKSFKLTWNVPEQGAFDRIRYVSWARLHLVEEIRKDLKDKFQQMVLKIKTKTDIAHIFVVLKTEILNLSENKPLEGINYSTCYENTLKALNEENYVLLINEINQYIDSENFLVSVPKIFLPEMDF